MAGRSRYSARRFAPALEPLEQRILLAVQPITRADPSRFGLSGQGLSQLASISHDGQVVAFQSEAPDLVPNDTNNLVDVFAFFPAMDRIELISVNASGTASSNGSSRNPKTSPDGRFVLFESNATDLISGVSGLQLYARDLQTASTVLVSANDAGQFGQGGASDNGSWSADSTKVVFDSFATNLVPNDTNRHADIFFRDLIAGTTIRVSVAQDGTEAQPGAAFFARLSTDARFSANGRFIVFESFANNLGPVDSTTFQDVYVKDLQTGAVDLVTIDSAGVNQPNSNSHLSSRPISADGRYVIFQSSATNLLPEFPFNNADKTFLRDRVTGTLSVVSVNAAGTDVRESSAGFMTPDGGFVAFVSGGTDLDLTVADTNGQRDVFVRDLAAGTTRLVSVNSAGTASANGLSGFGFYPNVFTPAEPLLSDDGRFVIFPSAATNLTDDPDTNNNLDVFVRDLAAGTTVAISAGGNGLSHTPAASADFQTVAFETGATNLFAGDLNASPDVVLRNVPDGTIALASRRSRLLPAEQLAGGALWSATPDGRYVAFHAGPSNALAPGISFRGFQTASAYVRDRNTGGLTVVDLTPDGVTAGGGFNPHLTPDGRFVAFTGRQPAGGSPPLVDGITFVGPLGGFNGRDVYLRDLETGVTRIVSVDPTGKFSDNGPFAGGEVAVSDDGRFVAFTSSGDNLVAGISNPANRQAIYQRDLWTNVTVLASHNVANDGAITGNSFNLKMTPDGRFITFASAATDLVAGDGNGQPDVFRWDRTTGDVELASAKFSDAVPGNNDSGGAGDFRPVITPDGRYIAFASRASDLVAGDTNSQIDVFVRDMQTGTTELVSRNLAGTGGGNLASTHPQITPDGKTIVFLSASNNLTATPNPPSQVQVYVRDVETGVTRVVSLNTSGTAASNGASVVSPGGFDEPAISPDGRYVAFRSRAADLVSGFLDRNGPINADVYLRDLVDQTTRLVTFNESGTAGGGGTNAGTRFLFADGSTLLLDTDSPDLFPGDRNRTTDVFAFTIEGTGQIRGTVFDDVVNQGTFDAEENGLVGVPVYLDANSNGRHDLGEARLQTDAVGAFAFTNLPAGTYRVGVLLPDGVQPTTPAVRSVALATDASVVSGQDFGTARAVADLSVTDVTAPASIAVGRPFDVTWTVRNLAASAISGDWQDVVYLSTDKGLDASDRLLGTVPHTGGLAAGRHYTRTASFATPAAITGNYFVLVQTDRRNQVPADTNRTNNLAAAFDSMAVTLPQLTLGVPTADSFTAANQDRYFQITVESGQSLQMVFESAALSGGTELYTRFAQLPTPYDFDHAARAANQPDQTLAIPLTRPGTYYLLARSRSGAAATSSFTVTATVAPFDIVSVSPNIGANTGHVTVEIRGTALTPTAVPTLTRGPTTIGAVMVDWRDPSLLFATFDLTDQPMGDYDVRIVSGDQSDILPGTFAVEAARPVADALQLQLTVPSAVRAGRKGKVLVEYTNAGNTDITAPLLRLTASDALLRLPGQADYAGDDVTVLGIAPDGPAGVLRPGQRGSVEIEFLSTGPIGQPIDFQLFSTDGTAVIDWAGVKDSLRPTYIPADAWDVIFANLMAEMGTTAGQYQSVLARHATYLSSVGIYTPDVGRLLSLELENADGALLAGSLASVVDSSQHAPGLALSFVRRYMQALHGRYTQGPFGRGWSHDWDIEAVAQASSEVVIRVGNARRLFTPSADGSYRGLPGDTGTLTRADGIFTLSETDGTLTRFRPDGRFDSIQDVKGNRIAAGYDVRNRLTSLTHSSGASITLTYNADDHIVELNDSAGRRVTYRYDASGEHLTGYRDQYGSHTYTYATGKGAAREHALESVNFSDDARILYQYDERGRLASQERGGGQERLTYGYLGGGALTVKNLAGATANLQLDDRGQLLRRIDPLGRAVDFRYDAHRNLTNLVFPGAIEYQYAYDARGNLTTATNAIGQVTSFAYDARNNLTNFTDAMLRTTEYHYDSASNLVGIDYPNGTVEQFRYDEAGNAVAATNRRGRTVTYQYNAAGQITRKMLSDERSVSYTYDARGRLETATDHNGTITLEYSPRDALTKISYPNGRFIQFDYNVVGQRTRMVDQDGFTVNYAYDALGRLDRLVDGFGALIVDYTYDEAGRLVRKDNGNGSFSTFAFDTAGQLVHMIHSARGGTVNATLDYSYDALGRRTSVTISDADPATIDGTTVYGYDPLGQLTSVQLPGGRIIQYEYDAVGNRTAVHDNGVTTTYTTNNGNEYTQVGDTTYRYDADGNLIAEIGPSGITTYTFGDDNRLTNINGPGLEVAYSYDAFLHPKSASINGQTTEFLIDPLDPWSVIAEYDASRSPLVRYTWGAGLTSRIDTAGAAAYYDFDATGHTVGLTDSTGAYVNRYSYLPFGETITHSAGVANPFTFLGAFGVRTEATGLSGMRYRNYHITTGRFTSVDPLGLVGRDVNFRRYSRNSPVNYIDPTGLADVPTGPLPGGTTPGGIHLPGGIVGPDGKPLPPSPKPPVPLPPEPQLPAPLPEQPPAKLPPWGQLPGFPDTPFTRFCGFSAFWIGVAAQLTQFLISIGAQFPPLTNYYTSACPTFELPPNLRPPQEVPKTPQPGGTTRVVGGFDPNDITGPAGFGPQGFIGSEISMPYTIRFENVATAEAPAQEVFVTHQLDPELDLATFQLGDFGFGSAVIDVPEGLQTYATRIPYTNLMSGDTPLLVDVAAELDAETRIVIWTFRSVDPVTGELPEGVFDGFLPPNQPDARGEGFVTYLVRPKADLATGARIEAQASIVFDVNPPIVTNLFINTLDAGPPASQVATLPELTLSTEFAVTWSGADDAGGSGIASYDVFVSSDGGPFQLWLAGSTATAETFAGQADHTYAFYSVATDNVGHREAPPARPDATTRVEAMVGDFNGDGAVTAEDIDRLCQAIRENDPSAQFDLNRDSRLTGGDVAFLLQQVLQTTVGDANLDRRFDSTDLVQVFQFGQYEDGMASNSGWAQGDWNCDGDFDSGDLVVAFQSGAYEAVAAARPDGEGTFLSLLAATRPRRTASTPSSDHAVRPMIFQQVLRRHTPADLALRARDLVFQRWQPEAETIDNLQFAVIHLQFPLAAPHNRLDSKFQPRESGPQRFGNTVDG